MQFAVIATETTGVLASDRALEIAVVTLDGDGAIIDEWDTLLGPGVTVGASDIHGITDRMAGTAPTFRDISRSLAERLDGAVLVAHNLRFHQRVLDGEFERIGAAWSAGAGVCTLRAVGDKLSRACVRHDVAIPLETRALAAARATAELFVRAAFAEQSAAVAAAVTGPFPAPARRLTRDMFPQRPRREAHSAWTAAAVGGWATSIDHRRYPIAELSYIDLLDRALDDRWLANDGRDLDELAELSDIAPARRHALHRMYVDDLYLSAMRSGEHLTADEFRQLDAAARALGIDLGARYPDFERHRPSAAPVVDSIVGKRVAFTGAAVHPRTGGKLDRLALVALSVAAGVLPQNELSLSSTDVLVAADPSASCSTTRRAERWGIPVISVADFLNRVAPSSLTGAPLVRGPLALGMTTARAAC